MSIPFKKFGYKLNPITREIETTQIFLVTKQLKKIGELYPIQDLRITINETNQPDEVSFTYYKEADGKPCSCFDDLVDLSVIQIGDYGFFEIAISKNENSSIVKTVTAQSLGHCELSQILATLEINTDEDMNREGEYRYDENYPTVFYRDISINDSEEIQKKKKESSLLNRILSYAPHYKIGYVSPTLKNVQRTFSWNDTDLVSILNDVATEISCMFDIQVTINEGGDAERLLNAYDMQYCNACWNALGDSEKMMSDTHQFRNIINGECQNCHSSESVKDIGSDTGIFISTDNLSDEITIVGDKDSIKNCFKVVGGDDLMTATVQGLNMSANNRIMMFSEEQRKQMTTALTSRLDEYETAYAENLPAYEQLLETQYNIYDMVQYLQSGKMPLLEEEIKTPLEALLEVVKNIKTYYENHFYISRWSNYDYTSAKSSIQNLFTTFMPKGFSFRLDTDNLLYATDKDYDSNKTYHWYGSIQIYSTDNKEAYVTLYVTQDSGTYIRQGKTDETISYTDPSNIIGNFSVMFNFADQEQSDYMSYLKQHTEYILSEVDLSYENEKARNWDEYSYNRLESYYDGFQTCIETLDDMPNEIDTSEIDTDDTKGAEIIKTMRDNYVMIQEQIQSQMSILLDQIFALSTYLGEYSSEFTDADGNVWYQLKNFDTVSEVLAHMIDPDYSGGYATNPDGTVNKEIFVPNQFIGTKPCKCKKCGSINVSVVTDSSNKCNNCGSAEIFTYLDIMQEIKESYENNKADHPKSSIADMRNEMRENFDLPSYFNNDALYHELLSFIREDVYTNDNYTSDGLTNAQLIRQAKELTAKAKQELSKACVPQYTITAPISAIVGQTAFEYQGVMVEDLYSGFVLNNYVHVQIDDEIYRMRIASIDFSFPVTDKIEVTFSNVSRYNNGVLSDVASILESASSMATSYSYVATQAEKGQQANDTFDTIKSEGLNAGLMAVKGGRDQDIVIDNHGILIRKKIEEIDDYSKYQMKIINRNIVLTDNNWKDAKMAIGLGTYTVDGKQQLVYGVWADLLVGDLMITKELHVKNKNEKGESTVVIDENGITLDGGAITWKNNKLGFDAVDGLDGFKNAVQGSLGVTEITSDSVISPKIEGGYLYITSGDYSVEIDPNHKAGKNTKDEYLFCIRNKEDDEIIMGVTTGGSGHFKGEITATSGYIGGENGNGWIILQDRLETRNNASIYQYSATENRSPAMRIVDGTAIFGSRGTKMYGYFDDSIRTTISRNGICINENENCVFEANTIDKKVAIGSNLYLSRNMFLDGNYYLYSSLMVDNVNINMIGMSNSKNLYLGMYYYNNSHHPDYVNSIILSASTTEILGTLKTPDGTVVKSDARFKTDVENVKNKEIDFILGLSPKKYKLKEGTSRRYHYGFIAQDVEKVMNDTIGDAGLLVKSEIKPSDDPNYVPIDFNNDSTFKYGLRYEEFIAPMVKTIQMMNNEIKDLKEELELLKEKIAKN